jgi:uracil-DNA glycosylase family 4
LDGLGKISNEIAACRRCARLVAWREQVACEKVKRFADETYWGRGVPGFGDARARVLIVGLAPAAHGANRTGRMFTGDRSGDWLFRALHKAGFANQPTSTHRDDGLVLSDCYIAAAARCAPPENKPTPEELGHCREYLLREIALLTQVRVVIGLGRIGHDIALQALQAAYAFQARPRPTFAHGSQSLLAQAGPSPAGVPSGVYLLGSFHPSQQNTFTGRLTEPMFDAVFAQARTLLDA